MRKKLISTGPMHSSDHYRSLVTDTLPGDVPIVISNIGFYRNMHSSPYLNQDQSDFVERLLKPTKRGFSIPYRYNIMRKGSSPRKLSLIHPSGQLEIAKFYQDNAELICFHSRKSEASIRSPRKIAKLFFVRGAASQKNGAKSSGIEAVSIESSSSNPATYFVNKGVDRAFKFFKTPDYLRLEKRFSVMHFADISKCFDSIYTHTMLWATADIETAKNNTQAYTFSNRFDRLMQSINYNETNGICVGAEVSRVFAELILSEVDRRVVLDLEEQAKSLRNRTDYEFRRYVDDYYIFAKNETVGEQVLSAIGRHLSVFNLHFNDQKTVKVARPFITKKSRMVWEANGTMDDFFGRFIASKNVFRDGKSVTYSVPLHIRRSQPLLRSLLDGIKANCFDNQSGYDSVSNYVIGALTSRIFAIIDGYELAREVAKEGGQEQIDDDYYVTSITVLLEAIYFFYNVFPTVPSSLRVAQASIRAFGFLKEKIPDRARFLAEQIVRWTFQFIRELDSEDVQGSHACVPLEAINVLLVLGELGREDVLARHAIADFYDKSGRLRYFEIVSFLFCLGDAPEFSQLRDQIFDDASSQIIGSQKLTLEAEAAHLALDLLCCPFITIEKRADLFRLLRSDNELSVITKVRAREAVFAFESNPWFVDWRGMSLLEMIQKKELSAVY